MLRVVGGERSLSACPSDSASEERAICAARYPVGASSLDTGKARPDTHLRQEGRFHIDTHTALAFHSRRIEPSDRIASPLYGRRDLGLGGTSGQRRQTTFKPMLTTNLNRCDC